MIKKKLRAYALSGIFHTCSRADHRCVCWTLNIYSQYEIWYCIHTLFTIFLVLSQCDVSVASCLKSISKVLKLAIQLFAYTLNWHYRQSDFCMRIKFDYLYLYRQHKRQNKFKRINATHQTNAGFIKYQWCVKHFHVFFRFELMIIECIDEKMIASYQRCMVCKTNSLCHTIAIHPFVMKYFWFT